MDPGFQPTHYPVFYREILQTYKDHLTPDGEWTFLDGTGGEGGHVALVLGTFVRSRVVFLDRDPEMIERAWTRLEQNPRAQGHCVNYSEVDAEILQSLGCSEGFDGILLDLGISTYHLKESGRGFTFRGQEALDMRLDGENSVRKTTAATVVNHATPKELERIFYEYGEERWTKKIVERIVERRKKNPLETNEDLAQLVEASIPRKFWPPKNHPALRVFQALRIEVNQELEHLSKALDSLPLFLRPGGVFQVISFHSLEDRIVKHSFRDTIQNDPNFEWIYKKPVLPSDEELAENPPSRSAKLRAIQRRKGPKNSKSRKYSQDSAG